MARVLCDNCKTVFKRTIQVMPNHLLDSLVKLINSCVELAKTKEANRQRIFDNSVVPLFKQFELVHKGYQDSVIAYRNILTSSPDPFDKNHPLLRKIREDAMLNESDRINLKALFNTKHSVLILLFLREVATYLGGDESSASVLQDLGSHPNMGRIHLIDDIERLFDGRPPSRRAQSRPAIMRSVERCLNDFDEALRWNYSQVVREYSELRKKLTE
ncbi:MAG TPA: hypothetical protein VHS31_18065 [Tepidisphaeraceae bacterium]|jgi:hypothetical protein|nr:hypothetical protein [Tepidisphaeraceae bacterium]